MFTPTLGRLCYQSLLCGARPPAANVGVVRVCSLLLLPQHAEGANPIPPAPQPTFPLRPKGCSHLHPALMASRGQRGTTKALRFPGHNSSPPAMPPYALYLGGYAGWHRAITPCGNSLCLQGLPRSWKLLLCCKAGGTEPRIPAPIRSAASLRMAVSGPCL